MGLQLQAKHYIYNVFCDLLPSEKTTALANLCMGFCAALALHSVLKLCKAFQWWKG